MTVLQFSVTAQYANLSTIGFTTALRIYLLTKAATSTSHFMQLIEKFQM